MSPVEHDYETALLDVVLARLHPDLDLADPELRERALELARETYRAASKSQRSRLRRAVEFRAKEPPPWLLELGGRLLGLTGLHRWARTHAPRGLIRLGAAGDLAFWLQERPPLNPSPEELAAGRRAGLDIADDQDAKTIDARLGHDLRRVTMQEKYDFDPRALPPKTDGAALETAKNRAITDVLGDGVPGAVRTFILGALSLDGRLLETDPTTTAAHIRQLRNETEGVTPSIDRTADGQPEPLTVVDALKEIAKAFNALRGGDKQSSYYEEFAFVARELIGNSRSVPIDASGLEQRVASTLATYVPGQHGGTFVLPELEAPEVIGADLKQDNILAVSLLNAAWNLEELKLFQVLDRITELFTLGQLPLSNDNGGRELADWLFSPDEVKMTEAARRMTYTRVLGVPGGEVSKEAPPNRAFQDLFLRFLSSVSEFDRQRRIADVVAPARADDSLSLTAEQVRKSGRDLAANMTLFGYGGTFFVAQKIKDQIARAIRILSTPEILAAYGVQSPFQVIERVAASDLGGTVPNITRHKTMAEAGKDILDIVATHRDAWISADRPLFTPRAGDVGGDGRALVAVAPKAPAIDGDTERRLMRHVEHWLAVNGIKDEQRARLGEPELTAAAPSIPGVGGDGGGGAQFDQLRQMISAGQTPSLDQLKALLPDAGAVARV